MSYRIEIKAQSRTVLVIHEGEVDLTDMESGRAQAVALLTEHGYSRFLVDTRGVTKPPSPTEHHRFASSQPLYMPAHVAIAVVMLQAEYDAPRLFETMSRERGVQIQAFADMDEAQAWLIRVTN
jgi:hypothetical protein